MYSITKCPMSPSSHVAFSPWNTLLSYGVPHCLEWSQHPFNGHADPSQDVDNLGLRELAWYAHA